MTFGQERNHHLTEQMLDLVEMPWTPPDQKHNISQARLATVKQLATGVSHHFNNSLQIIMMAAELAMEQPNIPNDVKNNMLALIIKQSEEAAELSRQLLDFSGEPISGKKLIDLIPVIQETVETLEDSLPENIDLSLIIEEKKPGYYLVQANPSQIRQALINLISNAREAMPRGGNLQVRISSLKSKESWFFAHWIVLSVTDSGTGIADETLPHIFEPFFTTKELGQGTGMGLAQVYGIVKQHSGEINVESRVGAGTTISLYFPT